MINKYWLRKKKEEERKEQTLTTIKRHLSRVRFPVIANLCIMAACSEIIGKGVERETEQPQSPQRLCHRRTPHLCPPFRSFIYCHVQIFALKLAF